MLNTNNVQIIECMKTDKENLGRRTGNLGKACGNGLRDFLILMRQKRQSIRDIIPLPLCLAPW